MIFVGDKLVEFSRYPNGEAVVPVLDLPPRDDDRQPNALPVDVRLQWTGDEDLLHLALVRGLIRQRYGGRTWPKLFIDYMPYSRMDREQNGHCFSLRYVAEAIYRLDWKSIEVVEPHSQVTLDVLEAKPVWATARLTPLAMKDMDFVLERDWLVLPDAGAAERYLPLLNDLGRDCNVIVLKKNREFESGKIIGLDVDYRIERWLHRPSAGTEAQALIIDDLSSRGGTFVQAASILRHSSLRCANVRLLVTHMEPVGFTGELPNMLDKVYCTDTMPWPDDATVPDNFYVFDRKDWL